MAIYNRRISVTLPVAIAIVGIALLVPLVFFSLKLTNKKFFDDEGPFWLFMVGLVPGLLVALLQFALGWAEFVQISKFNDMKIKAVLESRDLGSYYARLLASADTRIDVQGVTASRFMRDFADEGSHRDEKKGLILALRRGVKVRFLLPEKGFLDRTDHAGFDHTRNALNALRAQFPNELQCKYFAGTPVTSLVRIDDEIIVGPVFPKKASQHTPAIHTVVGSRFGQSYMENLEEIWSTAQSI